MTRVDVAVGVVRDNAGRILIAKRKDDAHQGGLWEFPGGKLERDEDDQQALNRELHEELGIRAKSSRPLIKIHFDYPECRVHLHVREVYDFDGAPEGLEGQECRWVTRQELCEYTFPEANKGILAAIKLERQYAITRGKTPQEVLQELESFASQGVRLVQIRLKGLSMADTEEIVAAVRDKCKQLGLRYLLNLQPPVKRNLDESVHLSSSCLMRLTQRPDTKALVAASCHSLEELRKAESMMMDFAVLSPVMSTSSHPDAKALGWQQFAEWVAQVNIPVFALGGVAKADYNKALACGAQGVSGISLFNSTPT